MGSRINGQHFSAKATYQALERLCEFFGWLGVSAVLSRLILRCSAGGE
jgi:hypothetical protein